MRFVGVSNKPLSSFCLVKIQFDLKWHDDAIYKRRCSSWRRRNLTRSIWPIQGRDQFPQNATTKCSKWSPSASTYASNQRRRSTSCSTFWCTRSARSKQVCRTLRPNQDESLKCANTKDLSGLWASDLAFLPISFCKNYNVILIISTKYRVLGEESRKARFSVQRFVWMFFLLWIRKYATKLRTFEISAGQANGGENTTGIYTDWKCWRASNLV